MILASQIWTRGLLDERRRRRAARRHAADVHGARRDDLGAGRRAQHRPRGDDAARRLRRLPRRLLRRLRLGRLPARDRRRHGRVAHHGRPLRLARARPDRRRDRDHARRRGDHERAPAGRSSARPTRASARRRRSRSRCSTGCPCSAPSLFSSRWSSTSASPSSRARLDLPSTNIGLNLRAAGEKPEALDAAGVSVVATRSYAVLATGALAGLGGAYLAIAVAGVFTPFITQGQGFMAIVIAMLARGRPLVGAARLLPVRDRALALRLAAARRDQHLDRRRPHAPVRGDHRRADRCSPAAPTCRPPLRCRTSAARAERRSDA